jgi:hypothetical protein
MVRTRATPFMTGGKYIDMVDICSEIVDMTNMG